MIPGFTSILFLAGCLTGVFLFIWLSFFNPNQRYAGRLLGSSMLVFACICLHVFLTETTLIREVPGIFRFTKPLLYLPGVFLYLYTRAVLNGEQHPRISDLIFFVPSMIQLVVMIPFFLMDRERKMEYVDFFLNNMQLGLWQQEGLFPPFVFSLGLIIFLLSMLLFTARIMLKASTDGRYVPIRQNHVVFNWLYLFFSMNLLVTLTLLMYWFAAGRSSAYKLYLLNIAEVSLLLMAVAAVLARYPKVLYGFQGRMPLRRQKDNPRSSVIASSARTSGTNPFREEYAREYMGMIEKTILDGGFFRNKDLSISDIARMTGIPADDLSAAINQESGIDFNTLVNKYRVGFVKELLRVEDPNRMELQRIAQLAGFRSAEQMMLAFAEADGGFPFEFTETLEQPLQDRSV
jgi:AraC-like DNA-binding protein